MPKARQGKTAFRTVLARVSAGVLAATLTLGTLPALADSAPLDPAALAEETAKSAGIEKGDGVIILGNTAYLEMMEALALSVAKRGGRPQVMVMSDDFGRAYWGDVDPDYLQQKSFISDIMGVSDVLFMFPLSADYQSTMGMTPDRLALQAEQFYAFQETLVASGLRGAMVSLPNPAEAIMTGLSEDALMGSMNGALTADYDGIEQRSADLAARMRKAKTIRITNEAGTDLTFSVGDRPIVIDDGRVSKADRTAERFADRFPQLPTGSLSVAPVESSVNGTVVVPFERCPPEPITDLRFTVTNGTMTDFGAAANGGCIEAAMAAVDGPKDRFGAVIIGLNPAVKMVANEDTFFIPAFAGGGVTLILGDNSWLGGDNENTGAFSFALADATVEVDGKAVIRKGSLVE